MDRMEVSRKARSLERECVNLVLVCFGLKVTASSVVCIVHEPACCVGTAHILEHKRVKRAFRERERERIDLVSMILTLSSSKGHIRMVEEKG